MCAQAAINDSYQSSQAPYAVSYANFAPKNDAEQHGGPERYADVIPFRDRNRQPGYVFRAKLQEIFDKGGTLGKKKETVYLSLSRHLRRCFQWLKDNPRYSGVFGRMSVEAFRAKFEAPQPKSTRCERRKLLIKAGLIQYTADGRYVDFAHWDEPVARAHYHDTRRADTRRKYNKRADQKSLFSSEQVQTVDGAPNKMPQNTHSEAEFEMSGLGVGSENPVPASESAASGGSSSSENLEKKQAALRPPKPDPISEPRVLEETPTLAPKPTSGGADAPVSAQRTFSKQETASIARFDAMIPQSAKKAEPEAQEAPEPAEAPAARSQGVVSKQAHPPKTPALDDALTPAIVAGYNRLYGLKLSYVVLKGAKIGWSALIDGVYTTRAKHRVDPRASMERSICSAAKQFQQQLWRASYG